jgi:hypothetical protein
MIVKQTIDPSQLLWYLQSALNGFDTLEPDDAAEHAKHKLRDAISYVNKYGDGITIKLPPPNPFQQTEDSVRSMMDAQMGQKHKKTNKQSTKRSFLPLPFGFGILMPSAKDDPTRP